MSNLANVHKCGFNEVIIFILAIIFGTGCSICSKTMMSMEGTTGVIGQDGKVEVENFQKPLFQTFGMFIGMLLGLVMHWIVLAFHIPFPGYHFGEANSTSAEKASLLVKPFAETPAGVRENVDISSKKVPTSMYFFLAIPAIFDLVATALCMMGLQYLDVSIYQMLRGSGIIFVALMKQYFLKEHLQTFHWVGVFWNVVSVVIVGATALLASGGEDDVGSTGKVTSAETFLGVGLMLAGAFVQALQFVFEEHVMKMDVPAPPLLLIGMEGMMLENLRLYTLLVLSGTIFQKMLLPYQFIMKGFWGTMISVFVMYPIGYWLPGTDHGSYEDPFNTWAMLMNSRNIQVAFVIYFFTIFFYNLLAVLVTFLLSSVWHAILDNFRPITVWGADLFIYYHISPLFGEVWTKFSYLQILGMAILVYGTAVYNGPNEGSILLTGQWYAFGIDCSNEYNAIRLEQEESYDDNKWEAKRQEFKVRTHSSFRVMHNT